MRADNEREAALQAYIEGMLRETREELVRADNKASILFASGGVILGAILAGILSGDWQPDDLDRGATEVFWLGAAVYVGALIAVGYSIWPRLKHDEAQGAAFYFGDVREIGKRSRSALREALKRGAETPERATEQLLVISDIVWKKMMGIRATLVLAPFGLTICAGAVIFG